MQSKLSQSDKDFIIKHYPTKGGRYCAEHVNQPFRRVQGWANKHGLRVTPRRNLERQRDSILLAQASRRKMAMDPTSYQVNHTQFVDVKTPEAAYLLGLLWADGYVDPNGINIECQRVDLETLVPVFDATGQWYKNYRTRKGRKPQMRIGTTNKLLRQFLIEHDYVAKSSASADKILSRIPEHLKHYWWRGLIDGDGCFYVQERQWLTQFSIASSYEQDWGYVERLFAGLGLRFYPLRRRQAQRGTMTKNSIVRLTNRQEIVALGRYVYQDYPQDGIGLRRKYLKWSRIVELAAASGGRGSRRASSPLSASLLPN